MEFDGVQKYKAIGEFYRWAEQGSEDPYSDAWRGLDKSDPKKLNKVIREFMDN